MVRSFTCHFDCLTVGNFGSQLQKVAKNPRLSLEEAKSETNAIVPYSDELLQFLVLENANEAAT